MSGLRRGGEAPDLRGEQSWRQQALERGGGRGLGWAPGKEGHFKVRINTEEL